MSVLSPSPKVTDLKTGVDDRKKIAEALTDALSDTYMLMIKTHAFHWNVVGPLFYSVHKLTEAQYQDMFAAVDELAERIRALGHLAPMSIAEMAGEARIEEASKPMSAHDMVAALADDHEALARRLHAVIELADAGGDPVTADMATARSGVHEQAVWMLRAIITE